jgi:hypothetical protein
MPCLRVSEADVAFYDLITWIARHGAVACAARFVAKDSVVGALPVRRDARRSEL